MKLLKILPLFIFSFFSCQSTFTASFPKWLKDTEKSYPAQDFIKATGEGNSLKAAESSAVASISLVFDTKTNVRSTASKGLSQIQTENKAEYAVSQNAVQVVNIQSDAEFLCTRFEEPWYDKKKDKYTVLAYINRAEAFAVYQERINHLMNLVKKLCSLSETENELFVKISNYEKARSIGLLARAYINNAQIVKAEKLSAFQDDLRTLEEIDGKIAQIKPKLKFSVSCNEEKAVSVTNHLVSLLEEKGFTYSEKEPLYTISMDLIFAEEHYQTGEFVRPTIKIQIKNKEGKSVKSYSKSYARYGGKTMETAYTRTYIKIQEDLSENFLSEF